MQNENKILEEIKECVKKGEAVRVFSHRLAAKYNMQAGDIYALYYSIFNSQKTNNRPQYQKL